MRAFLFASPALLLLPLIACGGDDSSKGAATGDAGADATQTMDAGAGDADAASPGCAGPCPQSNIRHLVVIVQENHTFDNHFGRYCTAAPGSNPTCNDGPGCCEAAPGMDAIDAGPPPDGGAAPPFTLDDAEMGAHDPDHTADCETQEIDNGKMDKFAAGASCSDPHHIAYASGPAIQPYWDLAKAGSLADRYFQSAVGQSTSNDFYLARAQFVFKDDQFVPKGAVGSSCAFNAKQNEYTDPTIGDLLIAKNVPWSWYSQGYGDMKQALASGACPDVPADCAAQIQYYPCVYDPSDNPFQYYPSTRDNPDHLKDFTSLATDLAGGTLPAVVFVKALGRNAEYPGYSDKLSDGVAFSTGVINAVLQSSYKNDTLVLLTYDEGGGYFDHVTPPATSTIDNVAYGTRIPLLALGAFAKKNFVSHVPMEHSSIVKFIEWNWLGAIGQLKGRDTTVANIGSLLDTTATGAAIP